MGNSLKLKFSQNPTLTKEEIPDNKERGYQRRTDKVPKKVNKLIAIIFREDKGAKLLLVNSRVNDFVHNGHLYFLNPEATYITDNQDRMAFYLEGVSTPMSHSNIEKMLVKVQYKELNGTISEKEVMKIKGLKYDSRILQIFTDRKFAEVFTRIGIDKWAFYTFICLIAVIVLGVVNCIVSFYFK